MEKVAPTSQDSEDELEAYLGIPIKPTKPLHLTLQRKIALAETFLCTNGFNIIFLLTYTISLVLMFLWGAHDEYVNTSTETRRWIIATARGFGYTLNLNCGLVILLASKLIFMLLRETPLNLVIPFDKTFPKFHMLVGYVIFGSVIGHGIFHMAWIIRWSGWGAGLWGINMCVATGFSIAASLVLMVASSISPMRKNHFPLFYTLHNIGATFFFGILLVHGVYNGIPYTYKWLAGPLFIYAIDRIARKLKVSTSDVKLSEKNSVLKGADIIKVRIPKQFNFRAGQYAELKVPAINKYEWHPFTIASAPFEESMCFYIKAVGDWTRHLHLSFEERFQGNNPVPLQVLVRGPFGAPAQHIRGYQRVILISGGVGATPFASIYKDLFHHINVQGTLESQHEMSTPDSPAMIKAESDIRSRLSDMYQSNFANEEDFMAPRPSLSVKEFFSENDERYEHYSPISAASEQPFSRRSYLNSLGISLNWKREPDPGTLTPISIMRETRYTLFKHSFARRKGAERFETADDVRADLFAPRAERLLIFFHSVILNMILCVAMLLRVSFVACASIFRSSMFTSPEASRSARETTFASLDASLAVLMIGILLSSIIAELLVYRSVFFKRKARIGDVFVLLPLATLSMLYSLRMLLGASFFFNLPAWAHFLVILPLLLAALSHRLYRIIGSKIALADFTSEPSLEKLRAVDFIWTVPFEKDDRWLREELEPVANGRELRLHRFLTRQDRQALEEGRQHRGITTTFGRPNWETVFTKLAERTPSGGKVGVFFCGPKGMAEEVVSSIMKRQVLSNLRGNYLVTSSVKTLKSELKLERDEILRLRARGCNIRFVFREENFS